MRATALLALLAAVALSRGAEAQLSAIQSAEETALNAYSAFKNLQLGRSLNTSASAPPLNGTLTCFLDPASQTVVGLGVSSTASPSVQKPQLCGTTAAAEALPIPSPIVSVSVGVQKVGLGVSSLKFSTAGGGGDLFCGYQGNSLKTFEASSSSNFGLLSRGTLAAIDAKCANVSGREVLTAGEIRLTFTSSATVGGSFPLYAGVSAPAGAAAGGAGGEAKTEAPPSPPSPSSSPSSPSTPAPPPAAPSAQPTPAPTTTPIASPVPPPPAPAGGETPVPPPTSSPPPPPTTTTPPPATPSPSTPPSSPPSASSSAAAVSWTESVVRPDPVLAARVNATAAEGQAAADVAPPMLGVGAASDHVIIGGRLPKPMPGEEAAAASAAVSDLPGADGSGAGVLSGTGKAAEGKTNETLSLASGAGVSASGDGDAGSNGSERQQLAGGEDGSSSSNASSDQSVISYASGTSGVSFTDSRAPTYLDDTKKVGQLYVCKAAANGACSSWSFCTASLVGKSLLVTAAHCVFSYGKKAGGWPAYIGGQLQVYYFPQVNDNVGPYGSWAAQDVTVPLTYYSGNDTCAKNGPGIVCSNDLALVWLKPGGNTSPPQQAGERLGYNAYGFNNWGMSAPSTATGISSATFQSVFGTLPSVMVTQIGYPVAFENGNTLQLSAAPAFRYYVPGSETTTGQTMLNLMKGSAVTGGASGGPWVVNYGQDAKSMATGTNYGAFATRDVVVGVTSWGFSSADVKTSATSVFGQNAEYPAAAYGSRGGGNIGFLIDWACDSAAGTWKLQSKGMCT